VKTGVQCFHNDLRLLDSGFRRNDGHQAFSTFCDFIKNCDSRRQKEAGGREILFLCPTCLKTFSEYDEEHRTGLLLKPFLSYLHEYFSFTPLTPDRATITYYDPCHLGRGLGSFNGTRQPLKDLGSRWVEMEHHHQESLCCGAGGGIRGILPKIF
jgi:Fe-S oxidoreductase